MKKAIRQSCTLFLTFCLTLILVGSSFIDSTSSVKDFYTHIEYSDISNNSQLNHSTDMDDDIFLNDAIIKSKKYPGRIEFIPDLPVNIDNNFSIFIWQPPKYS